MKICLHLSVSLFQCSISLFIPGRNSYDLEIEDSDKPTIYTEKTADHEFSPDKPFSETDTATVIRRSHVRVDLPAAGLGQRPPSVVSSDQEFPPLEHKDIPIPSPYAKRLQNAQNLESTRESKTSTNVVPPEGIYKRHDIPSGDNSSQDNSVTKSEAPSGDSVSKTNNQELLLTVNATNDQINNSKQETFAKSKEVYETAATSGFGDTKLRTSTNQSSNASTTNQDKSMTDFINSTTKNSFNEQDKIDTTIINSNTTNSKMKTDTNFDMSNKIFNKSQQLDNSGQPQTTWEQEKLKADQIAATKAQHLSSNQFLSKSQVVGSAENHQEQHVSSSHDAKLTGDDKEADNSIQEDSDSSDAKTVTNVESLPNRIRQNLNGQDSTPVKPRTQVPPVTPDTMTADEAENLLSSR